METNNKPFESYLAKEWHGGSKELDQKAIAMRMKILGPNNKTFLDLDKNGCPDLKKPIADIQDMGINVKGVPYICIKFTKTVKGTQEFKAGDTIFISWSTEHASTMKQIISSIVKGIKQEKTQAIPFNITNAQALSLV